MEDFKTVSSLDELLIYAYEVEQGAPLLPLRLEGPITLALHIQGSSWDRRIDKRSAQYVLALQGVFDNLLEEYFPDVNGEKLLVKVNTQEGSWESFADISPFLQQTADKMTDIELFITVMTVIAAAAGIPMWKRYQDRCERVELERERTKQMEIQATTTRMEETEKTAREAEQQRTLRASCASAQSRVDSSPERYAAYERPVRGLVKTMEEKDTIDVCNMGDDIPALVAQKCGPRRAPRSEEEVTYADGSYTVNSRRYDEGEVVLELMQGTTSIKGYLWQFDGNDRAAFMASLDRHEREDSLPFSMELQLNVVHTRKKLKHAIIVGEGEPRKGKNCLPLDSILH